MAVFALVNAAIPTPVPEYKKSTDYKMGYNDGRNAPGDDCLWMAADFDVHEQAWLHKNMYIDYLQGCNDSPMDN